MTATIQIGKHKQYQDGRTSGRRSIQSSQIKHAPPKNPTSATQPGTAQKNSTARKTTKAPKPLDAGRQVEKNNHQTRPKQLTKGTRRRTQRNKGSATPEAHKSPKQRQTLTTETLGNSEWRSKRTPSPEGIRTRRTRTEQTPKQAHLGRSAEQHPREDEAAGKSTPTGKEGPRASGTGKRTGRRTNSRNLKKNQEI